MADQPPTEPEERRRPSKSGPAVVALLSLSACGAQGAAPPIEGLSVAAPTTSYSAGPTISLRSGDTTPLP